MENFEKEVYSGNFTNMDLESYSKFFLMDEFCGDQMKFGVIFI